MMDWKVDFIRWHESRMAECGYSIEVAAELRRSRDKWLATVK